MLTPSIIATSTITLLICAIGLVMNILCLVVLLHKDMKSTYKYILQGLTLSDTFLLVLSTIRTLSNLDAFKLENRHLQIFLFLWDWICTSGTKYYTVAISLERFLVVTYPLQAHKYMTVHKAKMFALLVLLFVVGLSVHSYMYATYIHPKTYHVYAAIVLHFIPFALVLILNVFVFFGLRRYAKLRKSLTTSSSSSEESTTRMLFAVVVVFGICYSFEFVRRIMNFVWPEYMGKYEYYDYTINHFADIFYVLNSSVNFAIYYFLGKSFRSIFINILKRSCTRGHKAKFTDSSQGGTSTTTNGEVV